MGGRTPTIDDQSFVVNEGAAVSLQVIATDPDEKDTLTYSIVSGNEAGLFVIDPLTGVITLANGGTFDFEADPASHTLIVQVTDSSKKALSATATVTIDVADVNEAPTDITLSNLTVDENAAGAVVGAVSAFDLDDPTQPFGTHTLAVDDARFEIVGGVLKLKDGVALDHEAGETVTVTVTATDGGGLSLSKAFAVAVNDVNEAPSAIALSNTTVAENAAGAAVGTVTVTDPDDPTQPFGTHAFTVDDARFEVVGGVLKLKAGVALDHEAESSIMVTVTATDGGGLSASQAFTVAVNDVNEAPTAIALSSATVDENAAGAVIGTVTVTDPDNPAEPIGGHTLTVDDTRFEVVGGVLRLKAGVALDHEVGETVTVTVTATDGGGLSASQAFAITVNDLNEPPSAIALSSSAVDENTAGAVVGTVSVADPDDPAHPFGAHSLAVDDARFEVVGGVLKLKDGVALDHEAEGFVTLTVTATDGGGLSVSQTHTITVNDVNEAPTDIFLSNHLVTEEVDGIVVGQLSVSDPDDPTQPFGYHTITVDDPRFSIDFDRLVLNQGAVVDFETEPTVTLNITATDGGGLSVTKAVTLRVLDIVEGRTFISLGALDGGNGSRLFSSDPSDEYVGYSLSGAGDVNGDGYADMIVGVPMATAGPDALGEGASYVVFGTEAGFPADFDLSLLDGTNGFRINGTPTYYGGAGSAVSGAGDVNGDGYADIIVSALPWATAAPATGPIELPPPTNESFVIFGKADGWSPSLELAGLDGTDGFRMFSSTATDAFGYPVSGVGDFNGDGFDDLVVGDMWVTTDLSEEGVSYVVFGGASGWPTDLDLASLDGSNGVRIDGPHAGARAGTVTSAGDLNGDGFDDVAISVRTFPDTYSNGVAASIYVVYGAGAGWAPTLDLATLDPGQGFEITGIQMDYGPVTFGAAGDVNGDGLEDLIIGVPNYWFGGPSAAYIVYGDAGGFPATLDVSSLNGSNGFRIDGTDIGAFGMTVSAAGDINGDGIDDLVIASEGPVNTVADSDPTGSAYVVYGQAGGYPSGFDLALIDGANGFRLDGHIPYGEAGFSMSAAGDVNGDGFDDLMIGAPNGFDPLDPAGASISEAYLFYGGDFTASVSQLGTEAADLLSGTAAAESLIGAQGDDILVGNGGADVLYGGAGDDVLAVGDLSFARIDGGGGTDTLRLDGAGQVLDLTALGDAAVEGIERLDLTGAGDNGLTLAVTDLLQISDESNDLFVAGDAGDQVTVVGDWQHAGTTTIDGVAYNVYGVAGVDATLYVEDDVTVTTAATTGV